MIPDEALDILKAHQTWMLESMLKEKESLAEWLPRHYPEDIEHLADVKQLVAAIRAELFIRRGSG